MRVSQRQSFLFLIFLIINSVYYTAIRADDSYQRGQHWEYDRGPDVSTAAGRGYAKIIANTPNFRALGDEALKGPEFKDQSDKFRWKFGPMFYRGRLTENGVKVLIIGQEGAQEENVSFRSFTGGTGGRMQNFLSYLGINRSYLFINTFVYTITGQYADYAPRLDVTEDGRAYIKWSNQITWPMLRLAQVPHQWFKEKRNNLVLSPLVKHRHDLIRHVINSNKDSLRLVIAVGGAAQDSLANFIQEQGGTCKPNIINPNSAQKLKYSSVNAGGNRRFYFPVDDRGQSVLLTAEERRSGRFAFGLMKGSRIDYKNNDVQEEFKRRANLPGRESSVWDDAEQYNEYKEFNESVHEKMVRLTNGPYNNGYEDMAQLMMNLESCVVDGKNNTLLGLNGVDQDIRYLGVLHPGSNSPALQKKFADALAKIRSWTDEGWNLEPDRDDEDQSLQQKFEQGFKYTHKPIPFHDFRFGQFDYLGADGNTTTTRRDGGRSIEIGGREAGSYPEIYKVKDAYTPSHDYMSTDVPWEPTRTNYQNFDSGPGEYWAKVFMGYDEDVPRLDNNIFKIDGLPSDQQFGATVVYRGTPSRTEVLVLADQFDHDDMWVGRALMGHEGQKLQSFLQQIGVSEDYAIIRTFPVDTLGASEETIADLMEYTRDWRKAIINKIFTSEQNKLDVKLVLTLGQYAEEALEDYRENINDDVVVVNIGYDYAQAFGELKKSPTWRERNGRRKVTMASSFKPGAIPVNRQDVPYGLPRWVGTAGDRIIPSTGKYQGKLFKIIAPEWSTRGEFARPKELNTDEREALNALGF